MSKENIAPESAYENTHDLFAVRKTKLDTMLAKGFDPFRQNWDQSHTSKTAKELYGIDNFTDMIGDETIAVDAESLLNFLTEKGHPALSMEPLM